MPDQPIEPTGWPWRENIIGYTCQCGHVGIAMKGKVCPKCKADIWTPLHKLWIESEAEEAVEYQI